MMLGIKGKPMNPAEKTLPISMKTGPLKRNNKLNTDFPDKKEK